VVRFARAARRPALALEVARSFGSSFGGQARPIWLRHACRSSREALDLHGRSDVPRLLIRVSSAKNGRS